MTLFSELVDLFLKLEKEPSSLNKQKLVGTYIANLKYKSLNSFLYIIDEHVQEKKQAAIAEQTLKSVDNIQLNCIKQSKTEYKPATVESSPDMPLLDLYPGWYEKVIPPAAFKDIDAIPLMFRTLSLLKGVNCKQKKIEFIKYCLHNRTEPEQMFLKRILLNKLRIGCKAKLLLKPLAHKTGIPLETLRVNYNLQPSLVALLAQRTTPLLTYGIAIKPMLLKKCQPSKFKQFEEYAYEEKYDGLRVHIHCYAGKVSIFSRNLLDLTDSLIKYVKYHLPLVCTDHFIIDGELCGIDFQTITRIITRKYELSELDVAIFETKLKLFDILKQDTEILLTEPYQVRKLRLKQILDQKSASTLYVNAQTASEAIIESVLTGKYTPSDVDVNNYEGIVLKSIHSTYKPNIRDDSWLKLKPPGLGADCLVLKAHIGTGAKSKYYSSYTLGVLTENGPVEVGQVGSGFTIADLELLTELILTQSNSTVPNESVTLIKPLILEIEYQGLQRSTKYDSSYSLRFPIFKRIRLDKPLTDVTTLTELLN